MKRPHIPLRVQLDAALLQLGLDPATAELDHDPALALRRVSTVEGALVPDANDPRYLVWRAPEEHQQKTGGRKPGAERSATSYGSDAHAIAKAKRLEHARATLAHLCGITELAEVERRHELRRQEDKRSRWPKGRKIA